MNNLLKSKPFAGVPTLVTAVTLTLAQSFAAPAHVGALGPIETAGGAAKVAAPGIGEAGIIRRF